MSKQFTLEQLAGYNGLNSKPAYIAYKGKVYNVSNVFKNGEHAGMKAGADITEAFSQAPHKEELFAKFPLVGTLVAEQSFIERLFRHSADKADLILRLALGIVFFAHGSQKLLGWFGGFGWTGTIGYFQQALGIPAFLAGLAILAEFFGGLFILFGFLTRPAALSLAFTMLVAGLKVSLPNGFFLDLKGPNDGIEYVFVLFMISLYFAIKGAGEVSVDSRIAQQFRQIKNN